MTAHSWFVADRRRYVLVAVIIFAGACGSALMYWITAQGVNASPDSLNYVEVARNLLQGNGFFAFDKAMTHYPPGYSLLLSGVGFFTQGDILLAARLIAIFLFGVNLSLLAFLAYICTKQSWVAMGCVILIFLSSVPTLSVHAAALSEAPFITFSIAGFIFLAHHTVRPNAYLLVLASLMIGFAAATRYIGIVLFPVVILAIFLLGNQSFKRKVRDSFVFAIIACAPLLFWLIRNVYIAQTATNREFGFHPIGLHHAKIFITCMHNFILPISSISIIQRTIYVVIAVMLIVVSCMILYKKGYIKQNAMSVSIILPSILIIYFLLYVVFLIVSISFVDASNDPDYRILLPIYLPLTVVCLSIFKSLSVVLNQRLIWYGYVLVMLFSVSINAARAIPMAADIHSHGSGFTARYWTESKTLAALAEVPTIIKIYSNGPDVIRFLVGRHTLPIPTKGTMGTLQENKEYQEQLNKMINDCKEGRAIIAYFNRLSWRTYLPSKQEIESIGNMQVIDRFDDGVIFGRITPQK